MTQRTNRIDELLRQEMTQILARDVDDPRIGFATITDVETAPDLRHARVQVSVIGPAEQRKTALAAMGRAMPFVRHELGKRLRLKRIPEFHLELDDSVERGTRILHLLDELEAGRAPGDPVTDGETLPTPQAVPPADPSSTEGLGGAAAEQAAREEAARRRARSRSGHRSSAHHSPRS
jgi:ribosome-binding factor A